MVLLGQGGDSEGFWTLEASLSINQDKLLFFHFCDSSRDVFVSTDKQLIPISVLIIEHKCKKYQVLFRRITTVLKIKEIFYVRF